MTIAESDVETAALSWVRSLGWDGRLGAEISPGGLFSERHDFACVVLEQRVQDALARLNPDLDEFASFRSCLPYSELIYTYNYARLLLSCLVANKLYSGRNSALSSPLLLPAFNQHCPTV